MSGGEHSERDYCDELQFQEKSEFTALSYYELFGGRMKETAKKLFYKSSNKAIY